MNRIRCMRIISVRDRFRSGGGGAEVSCPNLFPLLARKSSGFCPNITCFLARNGYFTNSRGGGGGAGAPLPHGPYAYDENTCTFKKRRKHKSYKCLDDGQMWKTDGREWSVIVGILLNLTGVVGGWRTLFSEEQTDRFQKHHEEQLKKFGDGFTIWKLFKNIVIQFARSCNRKQNYFNPVKI